VKDFIVYRSCKRVFDVLLSLAILPFALPLFAFGAIGSAVVHRTNPLFTQQRTGLGGAPFELFKIKTMRDESDDGDNSDAARLTKFGRFLRRTSIDELPQLINILRGDMSFVGPRPQIHHYVDLMSPEARRRYNAVPGLSGWSQVNGRNGISWNERFKQDVWYVDNASFLLDMKILWLTVVVVLGGRGVEGEGVTTMVPLHEELAAEAEKAGKIAPLPPLLKSLLRSKNATMSFSLHDRKRLQPTAADPRHLFALSTKHASQEIDYSNFFFDVWRTPEGSTTAFPIGTAGPFDVRVGTHSTTITETSETVMLENTDRTNRVREVAV
jgi:lipopolysaccharide/colanic/teichoic acid biosynthesis glycosyltransferase